MFVTVGRVKLYPKVIVVVPEVHESLNVASKR